MNMIGVRGCSRVVLEPNAGDKDIQKAKELFPEAEVSVGN